MKVIRFYTNEKQLIKRAGDNQRDAQRRLYETYAPKMLGVCRRYITDQQFAEDVMIGAFAKVFSKISQFKFEGSFEGWVRRIMVNDCISFIRKQKRHVYVEEFVDTSASYYDDYHQHLEVEEIQKLIDTLPDGYKMVFILYAIEGYKHKEIAEALDISESASKTQLFKARKLLQQKINNVNIKNDGTFKV
ncbi:RNA polymerase sigma factor [Aquimarina sp. ERC-38]|uniref:RNA polymerase sigma factor n=1 Tax=Aquimarina sp. ERC-38 TaxID=2949996 RepID=UPI002246E96B|nr:RNA polymerase sigma factor [Aquimarina sp. ERC-38]UZO82493.1 RNA polymerase sigma factor [Aquimarina sp. ERC-38]